MKCDKCNNEANFEIHFIDNENKKTIHLCKDCYTKNISEFMPKLNLEGENFKYFQEILSDLIGTIISSNVKKNLEEGKTSSDDIKICSNCGTSLEEIISKGKFGCSQCYEDFKDEVTEILLQTQGDMKHKGKVPERYEGIITLEGEIEAKEEILKDLIVSEDYEKAALVRDEIKSLKKDLEKISGEY